jgi:hypothetical protein
VEGLASFVKAFIDYLRVAVACLGFVLLDPGLGSLLHWLPDPLKWVQGLIGVALSAFISWLIFRVINPLSSVDFEWGDKLTGTKARGPVLDIAATVGQRGEILAVSMTRHTTTFLARWVLRNLMRRDLCIVIESSQSELQMEIWSNPRLVTSRVDSLVVGFGKADHDTHVIPFDLGLQWEDVPVTEFSAKLRYTAQCKGRLASWVARRMIRVKPTVHEIRKVGGNV